MKINKNLIKQHKELIYGSSTIGWFSFLDELCKNFGVKTINNHSPNKKERDAFLFYSCGTGNKFNFQNEKKLYYLGLL